MFEAISRSWEFTKLSYRTLLENKHLIVFPVLSSIAAVFVSLSFLLPFFSSGELQSAAFELRHTSESSEYTTTLTYSVGFLFYFCNYFAIMFFNTALVASVMDIMEGGAGRIRFGLSFAVRRIHSIFGWALVSALIGVLLKILERNQKTGRGFLGVPQ